MSKLHELPHYFEETPPGQSSLPEPSHEELIRSFRGNAAVYAFDIARSRTNLEIEKVAPFVAAGVLAGTVVFPASGAAETIRPVQAVHSAQAAPHARPEKHRDQFIVNHLSKGQTIWGVDEAVIDRHGGKILSEVAATEKASHVYSERQAEDLPIGFKVVIPLNAQSRTPTHSKAARSRYVEPNAERVRADNGGAVYVPTKHIVRHVERVTSNGGTSMRPEHLHLPATAKISPVPAKRPARKTIETPTPAPAIPAPSPPAAEPIASTPRPVPEVTPALTQAAPNPTSHHQVHHSHKKHLAKHHKPESRISAGQHTHTKPDQKLTAGHHHVRVDKKVHHVKIVPAKAAECSTNTTDRHLYGADKVAKIINYFRVCDGYSLAVASGITGALRQESGLDPTKIQGGGDSLDPTAAGDNGWGLAQDTPGVKIYQYEQAYGITGSIDSLPVQLEIITNQLKGHSPTGYADLDSVLRNLSSVSSATYEFTLNFEGPKNGGNLPRRELLAHQALQSYLAHRHTSHSTSTLPHQLRHHKHRKRHHAHGADPVVASNSSQPLSSTPAAAPAPTAAAPAPAPAPAPVETPAPVTPVPAPAPSPTAVATEQQPQSANSESPASTPPDAAQTSGPVAGAPPAPTVVSSEQQPPSPGSVGAAVDSSKVMQSLSNVAASVARSSEGARDNPTSGEKILETAKKFDGIYYGWGAGHEDPAVYKQQCPDPSNPPDNEPTGGPFDQNPSPCGVDCSSFVNLAIDSTFNLDIMGTVSETDGTMSNPEFWQEISVSQVGPGDIATIPGHVELTVSYDPQTGDLVTLGAHQPGTEVSEATTNGYFTRFFRYIGPGSDAAQHN